MSDPGRPACEFETQDGACTSLAAWVIEVNLERQFPACDAHRDATLLRFEAKDVSGIFPLSGESDG